MIDNNVYCQRSCNSKQPFMLIMNQVIIAVKTVTNFQNAILAQKQNFDVHTKRNDL